MKRQSPEAPLTAFAEVSPIAAPAAGAPVADDYRRFCDWLERQTGIALGEQKRYLVDSRLRGLLAGLGGVSLGDLVSQIEGPAGTSLRRRVLDAITTNETQWFRDVHPFTALHERILPAMGAAGPGPLRIWSAGCASGQEPYSIAMLVEEYRTVRPGALTRPVEVIATDIAPSVLALARAALYDDLALARGLSDERRRRHFRATPSGWQLRQEVRRLVTFREMSLLESFAPLGRMDVIFCRNVLIYFSQERKQDILTRMAAALVPDGYLLLGASESPGSAGDRFEMIRHRGAVLYRLKG
jgi:chemotaxis protein methyltransferase CheR